MFVIYKATNKMNGKSYIGYDSAWPRRKGKHIRESFNSNYPSYHCLFHKAIRKYGPEAFEWSLIYQSNNPSATLNIMESRLIKEHNTHYLSGYGYNMTYGGEGHSGPLPESHKQAISKSMTGRKQSEQHISNVVARKSKEYIITSPNGPSFHIKNLAAFCRKFGLSQGSMANVVLGNQKNHIGWTCRYNLDTEVRL